jgi:prepilin-type processing-associated H-X9-DG protein
MKTLSAKAKTSGLTLVELLAVICVIAILTAMLLPAHTGPKHAPQIVCMNNLKQIDIGFIIYADDNGGKFPMQVSVTNGGTMEFIYSDHTFPHFQKLSKILPNLNDFVCPLDKARHAATNYEALNDLNISYFLNVDASTNNPSHSILAGDRFLQANGQQVKPGLFILTTNLNMSWNPDLHGGGGNVAFADGHAEFNNRGALNSIVQQQPLATNRLSVP